MKKPLLVGVFSFLALAPLHSALAQTGSSAPVESTEAISSVSPEAVLEAQKSYNAGVALHDSGKLDEAMAALRQANKLNPNDAQTHYMMGMVYWGSKSYQDAANSFKRAAQLKPDWPEAHLRLGVMGYVLGKRNLSNEAYKKLLELKSPLAKTLQRIDKNVKALGTTENVRSEPSRSSAKQVEAAPASAPAVTAPSVSGVPAPSDANPAVGDSNNTSTTASSPGPTAQVTGIANGDPALSSKAAAADDSALTGIYRIGVGDVLDIRLLNSTSNRSTLYTVIDGGLIDFPIAGGPVSVAGLTTQEIQERITSVLKRLAVEERSQVAVGVRQYASHTVIVTGLVGSPGTKILRREAIPLYVLLAEAQPRPDAARVAVMRAGAVGEVVDLSDSTSLQFIVRPGDVVNVIARQQGFYYIAGRVTYPGQKVFQPGITLLQAILAAGGLARDNSVELSREGPDGHLTMTKLNLKEIKSGKIQDPKIQPGDRIEVFHKTTLPF
jgi:protein involved in polysaccharide export with SLBB domain